MMMLAVFRARSQCLDYSERLKEYGVPAEVVSTPKEAKIGCGICVRFDGRFYPRAHAVLRKGGYTAFKGYFKMEFLAGRVLVTPYR